MTTEAAARLYEAEHVARWAKKGWASYNPQNKPLEELPVIYGFNNGGGPHFLSAVLLSADGVCLGSHGCSSEAYMPADLGILEGSREDRHEGFRKHYPGGYRMEFVGRALTKTHEGLLAAIRLNQESQEESDGD